MAKHVFDYAMEMEKDGEAFYRDLAQQTSSKGLATILNMIADEEVKHYNIFKDMKEGSTAAQTLPPSNIMTDSKNIFQKMAESGERFPEEAEQKKYYEKAKKIEEDTIEFYQEKKQETNVVREKELLDAIIDEERRHARLFQEFIDYVSTPERWLEDAEWNHLDEY